MTNTMYLSVNTIVRFNLVLMMLLFSTNVYAQSSYCHVEKLLDTPPNCKGGDTLWWQGSEHFVSLFIARFCNLEHQIISLDIETDSDFKEVICVYQKKHPEKKIN